jgi:sugar lactone lactonase YvrE
MKTALRPSLTVFILAAVIIALSAAAPALAQTVETVDGVRVVHNAAPGLWGKTPKVAIEPVRVLGDVDTADENQAFYMPANIALDSADNLFVLDAGNHRIQKFGPDGKFLATFGRQGQGPGEFYFPTWLSVDAGGLLYVSDPNNQRVQVLTPDGKDHRTIKFTDANPGDVLRSPSGELVMAPPRMRFMINPGDKKAAGLPKLLKALDGEGKVLREFGEQRDFDDELVNNAANEVLTTLDGEGRAYLLFPTQNRIDKYAPDGRLLWRADRELPYSMEISEKGKMERSGGRVSIRMPRLNRCASGIAVDGRGRVWVATLTRQLKEDEEVRLGVTMSVSEGGGRTMGCQVQGDTEIRTTDAFKLDVFDADGALLGSLPLDFFVDGVFIFGDRLFLLDKYRGVQFREYRIKG